MKELKKILKCALVLTLMVALMSNSVDLMALQVQAEDEQPITPSVGSDKTQGSVSDNHAQDDINNDSVSGNEEGKHASVNNIEITPPEMEYGIIPKAETSALPIVFFTLDESGKVALKNTNEVKWIDRLDLTGAQFAQTLYNNLIEWTDNDGTDDKLILDSTFTEEKVMIPVTTYTVEMSGDGTQDNFNIAADQANEELYKLIPYLEAAFNSFDRDYPEVFWLTGSYAYAIGSQLSSDNNYCEATLYLVLKDSVNGKPFDVRLTDYQSEQTIKAAIETREAKINNLVNAVKDMTVVEKIKYFNQWLTENNEYNTDLTNAQENNPDSWKCISALTGSTGTKGPVCEGYARAFKVLCDRTGIPCVLVDGRAGLGASSEMHMWNYVQVDGNWYAVDVTWNDPVVVGGNAASGAVSGAESEEWLLVGSDTEVSGKKFSESHLVQNQASSTGVAFTNGPVLSVSEYTDVNVDYKKIDITVQFVWEDENDLYEHRPESVEVSLLANGSPVDKGTVTLPNNSKWEYIYEDMPVADENGEITYELAEDWDNEWYESSVEGSAEDGFTVTMHYTQLYEMSDIVVTPYEGTYQPPTYAGVNNVKNAVTIEGAPDGAKVEYSTDGGATWSETVPTISEAGELTVQVKVTCKNYEDYTKEVDANINRFNLEELYLGSAWDIELENHGVFYYTGEEVTPVIDGLNTPNNGMDLNKFVEDVDYRISYSNNTDVAEKSSENPPTITIQGIGNYEGTISTAFTIQYYDGEVTPLYNGSATEEDLYADDVVISAKGYTVSESLNGTYTETVTISGEGENVSKTLYFRQDGTGYIIDGKVITVNIDKTGPVFDATHGISIEDNFWNTLLNKITYGNFFKETKEVSITAEDKVSGVESYYYYLDTTGSTTVLTASALEELLEAGKFVADVDGSFNIEGDSKYVIYAYVKDKAGNRSSFICSDGVVLDTVAPELTVTTPTEANGALKDTSVTFSITADEDVMVGVCVTTDYSGNSQQIRIHSDVMYDLWEEKEVDKQTKIEDVDSDSTNIYYKTNCIANQSKEITITGLEPNTFYEYYVVAYDAAENETIIAGVEDSGSYEFAQFTTLNTLPVFDTVPAISGTYGETLGEMTLTQPTSTNGVTGTWSIAEDDKGKYPVVNGDMTYSVTFTPTDTNKYATITKSVCPTVEKKPIVATVANQTVNYNEAIPSLTYTIAADALVGNDTKDALGVQLSTTAVKGSNAGTYPISGTATAANYAVTFTNATLTIKKLDTVITVAAGKESYSKAFGDAAFTLEGIAVESDADVVYTVSDSRNAAGEIVADDKVITVSADGKVTIVGAGTAKVVVSVPETNNYFAAEEVVLAVNVAKATVADKTVERDYAYNKNNADSIDLAGMIPTDCRDASYVIKGTAGDITFVYAPVVVADGNLTYTLSKGVKGQAGTITVEVASDNYATFTITVDISLNYEAMVVLKNSSEVSVTNSLTYGDTLNKLIFADAVFVEEGTDTVVNGTLTWEEPDNVPAVADTAAAWVFIPDNTDYAPVRGNASISVAKAEQPEFNIVPVNGVVYGQKDAVNVDTFGGLENAEIVITVPENNGVVEANATGGFTVVGAGTVTITAVAKDTIGNYKDATANYDLTVAPATIEAGWIGWSGSFNGEDIYTGEEIVPSVSVSSGDLVLVQNNDYKVEYLNNKNAYTLTEEDEDFDADAAPAVIVTGMGNYAGIVEKFFVINKAENAPNMPATTKTVANSVDKAGNVSLPENWIWQDTDLTLAEGETKAVAIYNGSDKGNYVNETMEVTITRLAAGIPFVSEINGDEVTVIENGWNKVREDLTTANEGNEITVTMNGARILPGDVVEDIKDKDITVVLDMGNGVTWSINGKSVTADNVKNIDMHVDMNTSNIPVDVVNQVTESGHSMQISLAHNGEFGFTAVLSINLKTENAGYYAQLFYYQEEAKVLKFIEEALIDTTGTAKLLFTHASEYTIVIDDEPYEEPAQNTDNDNTDNNTDNNNNNNTNNNNNSDNNTDNSTDNNTNNNTDNSTDNNTANNTGSTSTTTSTSSQTVDSPKTGDNNKVAESLLLMISVIAAGMLLMIKRRKGEQER